MLWVTELNSFPDALYLVFPPQILKRAEPKNDSPSHHLPDRPLKWSLQVSNHYISSYHIIITITINISIIMIIRINLHKRNKNFPPEKPRQSQWWEDAAKTKEEESHQR